MCTEDKLKGVPEAWSFEDAAGLFVTAPTSYAGLVVRAGIKKGMCLSCLCDWIPGPVSKLTYL